MLRCECIGGNAQMLITDSSAKSKSKTAESPELANFIQFYCKRFSHINITEVAFIPSENQFQRSFRLLNATARIHIKKYLIKYLHTSNTLHVECRLQHYGQECKQNKKHIHDVFRMETVH